MSLTDRAPIENRFNVLSLAELFPSGFNFYGVGELKQQSFMNEQNLSRTNGVKFDYSPSGSEIASILICCNRVFPEESLFLELSNVLSSKIASKIGQLTPQPVMISPPQPQSQHQIQVLLSNTAIMGQTCYQWEQEHAEAILEVLLLAPIWKGKGNA